MAQMRCAHVCVALPHARPKKTIDWRIQREGSKYIYVQTHKLHMRVRTHKLSASPTNKYTCTHTNTHTLSLSRFLCLSRTVCMHLCVSSTLPLKIMSANMRDARNKFVYVSIKITQSKFEHRERKSCKIPGCRVDASL